jgi:hypothetical protein
MFIYDIQCKSPRDDQTTVNSTILHEILMKVLAIATNTTHN